jgi:hypothetical protein
MVIHPHLLHTKTRPASPSGVRAYLIANYEAELHLYNWDMFTHLWCREQKDICHPHKLTLILQTELRRGQGRWTSKEIIKELHNQ